MNNSTIPYTILLGVISGILTAGLIFFVSLIFRNILIPWYQRVIYKGVDLQGSWTGSMVDSEELQFPFRLVIQQNAHSLEGTASINKSTVHDVYSHTDYNLSGFTWEGYVTLNFRSVDRTKLAFATALLKVLKGGRYLEGHFTFRDLRHDEIRNRKVSFERDI